jgi:hypothetical protein
MLAYRTRSLARADRGVRGWPTMAQPRANSFQSLGSGWSTWTTKWSGALGVPVYCTLADTGGRDEMEVDVENHR